MDIFNSAQRTREDAVKKPITYHNSQIAERRLQQQHQRQLDQFQFYLRNLYAKFDFKINKCRHSCFANPKSYFEARNCEQQCGEGVRKFSQYVDSRVGEMQELLSSCVANAATLPNALDETYNCYQKYNRGFGKLKEFITEESMYYE